MRKITRLLDWMRKQGEFLSLPIAIVIWYTSSWLLRWIDPAAGAHDAGMFQPFLFATVGVLFSITVVMFALRIAFYCVYKSLDDFVLHNFDSLTKWQLAKYGLVFFFGLLYLFFLFVLVSM